MSQLSETLAKIDSSGGTITVNCGEVRLRVRPGSLSDQDREILSGHKADLIAMLTPVDVDTIAPHSGKTRVVSTSAAETNRKQHQEIEFVPDLDQWDNTVEAVVCDLCGSVARCQDSGGGWHCRRCDPPLTAQSLRRDQPQRKLSWPIDGADAVLALTAADLPPVPWRQGWLECFDNGRLLRELRIDLQVIGRGGVNHRSGRLRRDVAAILQAARLQRVRPPKEGTNNVGGVRQIDLASVEETSN